MGGQIIMQDYVDSLRARIMPFLRGLIVLDVADVVERETVEVIQALQFSGESKVAFGIE
jgi:hypothetical protein